MDLWERIESRERAPRVALSSERIALAAVAIADAEGLDAVSMRKVASRLNAGTMSLYRYVTSRDELVALMIDQVYSTFAAAPRSGDWRGDLTGAARRIREITLEHPWLAGRPVARLGLGPHFVRTLDTTLALVDGYGMSANQMLDVLATLQAFTQGYVLEEITEQDARRSTQPTTSATQHQQDARIRAIIESGDHPHFAKVVIESGDDPDPGLAFERRLRYVLDGLATAFP